MLYRYKIVTDEHATYRVNPPLDDQGGPVEGFFEHGTMDDGYSYSVVPEGAILPEQWPQCEVAEVTPPQQYLQKLREISPHYALMKDRESRGLYMRTDKHIVAGDSPQVADWVAAQKAMFGIVTGTP